MLIRPSSISLSLFLSIWHTVRFRYQRLKSHRTKKPTSEEDVKLQDLSSQPTMIYDQRVWAFRTVLWLFVTFLFSLLLFYMPTIPPMEGNRAAMKACYLSLMVYGGRWNRPSLLTIITKNALYTLAPNICYSYGVALTLHATVAPPFCRILSSNAIFVRSHIDVYDIIDDTTTQCWGC